MTFARKLYGQVFIALIFGIAAGYLWPEFGQSLKPLGEGFIKLIKMIIAPIIFAVVVSGICGAGSLRQVGRVGAKAVIYFELVSTLALVLGLVLAQVFQPGAGMNVDPRTLDTAALSAYTSQAHQAVGTVDFLLRIIPDTVVNAFATGDVLQVTLFSILFGLSLAHLGEASRPAVKLIESFAQGFFGMLGYIVRLAPLGVFGAVAFTVGRYGIGSLKPLALLIVLFYGACVVFVLGVLGTILRLAGLSVFGLIGYLREELLIVCGTASSDAVLPQVVRKLERLGISRSTVGLVIPTGYTFNLDGFSLYLTLTAVFIAQATNSALTTTELLTILGVATITSKGAAGVPGSAIVVLAATLAATASVPVAGLALVLGIDWFMGIGRALTNLVGNCVATIAVAAWEHDIDPVRARRVMAGEIHASL